MSSQPEALPDWNIIPEDLDCEKNPFLQMSQDQIQKLDAVLSSEQARALLRDSSNDRLFSDSDKLDDVLSGGGDAHGVEDSKLPAGIEETLDVSLKDLEHLVLGSTAGTELFPEATVGDMASDILDLESHIRNLSVVVWLDHSYALQPPQPVETQPVSEPPPPPLPKTEIQDPPVICEIIPQNNILQAAPDLEQCEENEKPVKEPEKIVQPESARIQETPEPEQKDDNEASSTRSEPRRRSQRQIEKTTREQVEKIRAENAEMERKEREEMERLIAGETTPTLNEDITNNELAGVVSELSKKADDISFQALIPEPIVAPKDAALEKRKRKKKHNSESDAGGLSSKSQESDKSGSDTSPIKSPRIGKDGKPRKRTFSESPSPTKRVDDSESDQQKLSEEKSPTVKKKKVKREKSYEGGPEPALFSLPDKMIKGSNDAPSVGAPAPVKPERKPSVSERQSDAGQKKHELPTSPVKSELSPFIKKESVHAVVEPIESKAKVVKVETPATVSTVKFPQNVDSVKNIEVTKIVKTVKREGEVPGKVVKTIPGNNQKLKKPEGSVIKEKTVSHNNGPKNQVGGLKTETDKSRTLSSGAKLVKHKVLTSSDPNIKQKSKIDIMKKSIQSLPRIPKTASAKLANQVREKTAENNKIGPKSEKKDAKKSGKERENIRTQKSREKRTIKRKPLDPNEIHPDEASDQEEYSDDPNDDDWDSEDDPDKLWCICKQPSNDRFMIQCDPCSNWFHGTCVGVSRQQGRQMEKDGVEWHCPDCVKNAARAAPPAPPVAEPAKPKQVKREVEVKPKQHAVKSVVSSSSTSNQCIVCKSVSKRDAVYCSENCIEQHVKEVLKLLNNSDSKTGQNQGVSASVTPSQRVVVMERWTGKLYTGPNAPTPEGLLVWLKANPTFEALKPGPPPETGTNTKKPKTSEKEEKPPETHKKTDPEPVRLNVRKTLKEILYSRCKGADDINCTEDAVGSLSQKIEEELYKLFKDTNAKYKAKYRSLMFNVKDPRNQGLFRKIVNRKIPPYQLVRMSPEELASKELAKWRERENQHTLEMIKKDQLENQQMQSLIIKKTHKGEVEIEDDNLSILEQRNDDRPEPKEEDMSDIKAMLADTTSEHKMHLFDLNCQICTGRKALSEIDAEKNSPEKRKIKIARTISMETPTDSASHDKSVTVAPKVIAPTSAGLKDGKDKESSDHKERKHKKSKKKVALLDEPSDHEPTSTVSFGSPDPELKVKSVSRKSSASQPSVWKGFIFMQDVTKFVTSAHKVSGPTGSLSQEIPDTVQVCGRIPPEEVWSYLSKIKQGGTKELIVMRFQPANDEEKRPYDSFYKYLNSRKRYGVVRNSSKMIKDFYIIPLGSHSPVPTVLMPFDGPGLDASRQNLLLGVIVRHKHKSKPPASAPANNLTSEKYDPTERSYTPPLDALPCQSTTVDSSIPTSAASAIPPVVGAVKNPALIKSISPALSPSVGISSPTNIPGILSPSTLIPSSLIASILAPKLSSAVKASADNSAHESAKPPVTDDEPYEPSYTPPLETASKLDEDKPYDPDDLDDLEVHPKVDVRSYLDAPSPPAASNPELEAQKKLLAELTRQVEEQKEQIEMQKTQVLAAAKNKTLCLDNSDILLPEMLQSILKNIQTKTDQNSEASVQGASNPQTDISLGNPIPVTVKPTSLSSMSAKELVERAQRELADLQKEESDVNRPPHSKKVKLAQNPIPTIGDSAPVAIPHNRTHPKAEPLPPGVDVEELGAEYGTPPSYYPPPSSLPAPNPYPSLAPAFQPGFYPQRDNYHQGPPPPIGQPPPQPAPSLHPPPPPPPPQAQQWAVPPGRDSVNPPATWTVPPPPGDPFYQGNQWSGPWSQPPPPPVGWNGRVPWNSSGQDTDARDSDLRVFQRRNVDRHYNGDRNRK